MGTRTQRSLISSLLVGALMLSLLFTMGAASGSAERTEKGSSSEPTVALRAGSGATITFKTQNGAVREGVSAEARRVPHLVLRRNGSLTDPRERTLIVRVTGIAVPPPGVTLTLHVETQRGDPDPPEGFTGLPLTTQGVKRIPVWRESRWIPNPSAAARVGVTAVFRHTFEETVVSGTETISTPTDYFRYEVTISEGRRADAGPMIPGRASRFASRRVSEDHAFLMEEQWIARLPQVAETSPGAAPDELIVTYTDMVPYQKSIRDPAGRLPREEVPGYVGGELVPRMVEAFRVQTDDWGFPWHDAWTSHRRGPDRERLSVALSDGQTWFHGRAPYRADSKMSINVTGGENAHYDTLTEGLMSAFHHELFHNLQRNINQAYGGRGNIDGAEDAWEFFTEGTAVVASSAGQPGAEFAAGTRAYASRANSFLGRGYALNSDLNRSYESMVPYRAGFYWRFLYEQCGRDEDGGLDPAAGMAVIRRALMILYSGEVVDIGASTDLVQGLPGVMDRALSESACPFETYAESVTAFTRAIYMLQLEDGRCAAPGVSEDCGFYDPHNVYHEPPVSKVVYAEGGLEHNDEIPNSFGVDFVELILDPTVDGKPLTVEVRPTPGATAAFAVEVWELSHPGEDPATAFAAASAAAPAAEIARQAWKLRASETEQTSKPNPPQQVRPRARRAATLDGTLSYATPAVNTAETNRLGLVITRLDANERLDPVGSYTIVMR